MRVLHLSTYISESSACVKLHNAMLDAGIDSHILCVMSSSEMIRNVSELGTGGIIHRIKNRVEADYKKSLGVRKNWPFELALNGYDLQHHTEVESADVIHLHWVCGLLSIEGIYKLTELKKPVVWTCHDQWSVTGGCNLVDSCKGFSTDCGNCPMVENHRVPPRILNKKKKYLTKTDIGIIAPSNWIKDEIISNSFMKDHLCQVIPNTDDYNTLRAFELKEIEEILGTGDIKRYRDKINILFGSISSAIPYKGFDYIERMLKTLREKDPETAGRIVIHIVGNYDNGSLEIEKYEHKVWGYVSDRSQLACIYSLSDVLVYPSWQDNLPSMVIESLACETPVLAFDTGGMRDIVDHKINGYIADYKNEQDFYAGFKWILNNNPNNLLGRSGRGKVIDHFSRDIVVNRHIDFYNKVL